MQSQTYLSFGRVATLAAIRRASSFENNQDKQNKRGYL